jgi:hypothetical protein
MVLFRKGFRWNGGKRKKQLMCSRCIKGKKGALINGQPATRDRLSDSRESKQASLVLDATRQLLKVTDVTGRKQLSLLEVDESAAKQRGKESSA